MRYLLREHGWFGAFVIVERLLWRVGLLVLILGFLWAHFVDPRVFPVYAGGLTVEARGTTAKVEGKAVRVWTPERANFYAAKFTKQRDCSFVVWHHYEFLGREHRLRSPVGTRIAPRKTGGWIEFPAIPPNYLPTSTVGWFWTEIRYACIGDQLGFATPFQQVYTSNKTAIILIR